MFFPIWKLLAMFGMGGQGIATVALLFWIWVLIDCVTKEPGESNDKIVWFLLVLFLPVLGAIIYFIIRRPERIKAVGH